MHHVDSLLSKCSLNFQISLQILSECTIYRPCFQIFLCSSKIFFSFYSFQNATITILIFTFPTLIKSKHVLQRHCFHLFLCSSKLFIIPTECPIKHSCSHLPLQFQIVLDTVRMHASAMISFNNFIIHTFE